MEGNEKETVGGRLSLSHGGYVRKKIYHKQLELPINPFIIKPAINAFSTYSGSNLKGVCNTVMNTKFDFLSIVEEYAN
jgi:hypothetical protein